MRRAATGLAAAFCLALASLAFAQEMPSPTPTPAPEAGQEKEEKKESIPFRPIESNVIINLPSVQVPPEGTLTFLVTHRFQEPLQDGNINNFFTLDVENRWGFGLWYAPLKNLNVGFYRTSDLNIYEASAQYEFPELCGFASSLRIGEDWRTEPIVASPHSSFFAQAILAYSFGKYVRITAVPTYLQRTNRFNVSFFKEPVPGDQSCRFKQDSDYVCSGLYENIFNVPVAASVALTHSITVHGEVYPRLSKVNSSGVGWAVTVEKSLLRHRFAFFAGNMRPTTVDQYTGGLPYDPIPGPRPPASNVYIGFNLYRAWKFK
ncbi:MAG: DUF5777 family beta-barrel protein [Thermoanaerobaculia bacterium]